MRLRASLVLVVLVAGLAACGSERGGAAETAETEPAVEYRDGTVASVSASELLLETGEGQETYAIDQSVTPVLGLDHIASHAGQGIGFRIYYSEKDGKRYLVRGEELGPAQ